jgi:hypothetical protein
VVGYVCIPRTTGGEIIVGADEQPGGNVMSERDVEPRSRTESERARRGPRRR